MKKYDAIIIGTGQAGPALAGECMKNGWKLAIIEKGHYGGTCVNVGCTPTKAYVASARRAFGARNGSEHGVSVDGNVRVDLKAVKARKDKIVEESRSGLSDFLEGNEKMDVYHGTAEFTGEKTVMVNGEELEGDKIFINVGGRPRFINGFRGVDYLTNESILELEEIPKHLVVVGGGYIGLEFAQMFRRFGSEVTVVERNNRLMHREDEDISEEVMKIFRAEGINLRLDAECISGRPVPDGVQVNLDCEEGDRAITGSHVLLAVGRIPNTDLLSLEKAGVETDGKGFIHVNDYLQSNKDHIYAMGDCNGKGAFTHTAYNDYQIVASHLFENGERKLSDRHLCYSVFIDPPLARVGMSEQEVREKGINAMMATMPMKKVARAKEKGETFGLLKILVDADSDKFLGATYLGVGADEYIHSIIDMMYADAPYTIMRDAVHIHPTVSELIPTMLEGLEPLEK